MAHEKGEQAPRSRVAMRISEIKLKGQVADLEQALATAARDRDWYLRQRDDALARERQARVDMGQALHKAARLREELRRCVDALEATTDALVEARADLYSADSPRSAQRYDGHIASGFDALAAATKTLGGAA